MDAIQIQGAVQHYHFLKAIPFEPTIQYMGIY
jgi:hypothetical protein